MTKKAVAVIIFMIWKAQEFEVKLRDDMLVIVGLFNTKDNNIQAKLDRMPAYPSKVKPTAAPL